VPPCFLNCISESFKKPPLIHSPMLDIGKSEGFTKYERARLIGARALQISQGAPLLLKLSEDDLKVLHYNPIEIAKREFEAGILPLDVRREVRK
jgi:DNA-directed RNA polymerase subunit K